MVAARLQNVIKAENVGGNIRIGIDNRIADARLCGEMDDDVDLLFGKEAPDRFPVGEVAAEYIMRKGITLEEFKDAYDESKNDPWAKKDDK